MSDSREYVLIVPAVPPVLNHYLGMTKTGRRYRKPAADRFDLLVQAEWANHHGKRIEAPAYAVDILIQLERGRKGRPPDLDAFCKVGIDSLVHAGVILDDVRITDLSLHKQWGDCEQCVFTIRPFAG